MNPNYTEFKFPAIRAHPWSKVFSKRLPPDAVDLVRAWGVRVLRHSACQSVPSCAAGMPLRSWPCAPGDPCSPKPSSLQPLEVAEPLHAGLALWC
jgi:hypothetical protein